MRLYCCKAIFTMKNVTKIVVSGAFQLRPSPRFYWSTPSCYEKIVEVVPALGESITEGTIARWMKEVGDKVEVDDVVVVVETDKVTVDIKSSHAGVLLGKLAEDNVHVGNPLFEIDTDGAGVTAKKMTELEIPAATVAQNDGHKTGERVPLIKFLGKRALIKRVQPAKPQGDAAPRSSEKKTVLKPVVQKVVKIGTGVDFTSLKGGAWYGRPLISTKEMEAINSGIDFTSQG